MENKTHSEVRNVSIHKNNLNFKERHQAKETLKKINLKDMDSFDVSELNELFAKSVVHFWPDYNYFSVYENWLLYLIQKTESNMTDNNFFGKHERLDWEKVWQSGFGLCSQISLALYDYLIKNGQKAYLVALDGHVVVSTIINGNRIKEKYLSAGYSPSLVKNLVNIYNTQDNNKLVSLWGYYPTYLIFFHFIYFLKWFIPVLFISNFYFPRSKFYWF